MSAPRVVGASWRASVEDGGAGGAGGQGGARALLALALEGPGARRARG